MDRNGKYRQVGEGFTSIVLNGEGQLLKDTTWIRKALREQLKNRYKQKREGKRNKETCFRRFIKMVSKLLWKI